jgi:hypothetical protein
MRKLLEIQNILREHKNRLFRDYPIKSMAIFGSYSRSEQNDSSDLDILVEFTDKIGIRFIDLADELEDIVGFRVDLVSKKGVKDKYLKAIDSELIYV